MPPIVRDALPAFVEDLATVPLVFNLDQAEDTLFATFSGLPADASLVSLVPDLYARFLAEEQCIWGLELHRFDHNVQQADLFSRLFGDFVPYLRRHGRIVFPQNEEEIVRFRENLKQFLIPLL